MTRASASGLCVTTIACMYGAAAIALDGGFNPTNAWHGVVVGVCMVGLLWSVGIMVMARRRMNARAWREPAPRVLGESDSPLRPFNQDWK